MFLDHLSPSTSTGAASVVEGLRFRPGGGGGGCDLVSTIPGFVCRKVKDMGPFLASSQ